MVNQLQAERYALAARVQKPVNWKLVESVHPVHGSTEVADLVFDRASKRRACGEEIPSTEQALCEWLKMRDALEMGSVKDLAHLIATGSGKFDSMPTSMVTHMVT